MESAQTVTKKRGRPKKVIHTINNNTNNSVNHKFKIINVQIKKFDNKSYFVSFTNSVYDTETLKYIGNIINNDLVLHSEELEMEEYI